MNGFDAWKISLISRAPCTENHSNLAQRNLPNSRFRHDSVALSDISRFGPWAPEYASRPQCRTSEILVNPDSLT